MKVVHFGTYSTGEGYPRNAVVAKSLEAAGVEVIKCHRDAWGDHAGRERVVTSIFVTAKTLLRLIKAWTYLTRQYLWRTPEHDLVIVGYPGHLDIFLARLLAAVRSKPVVLDAFLSLYEAVVEDRKLVNPSSARAKTAKFLDRIGGKTAHAVLLDTREHIRYYRDVMGIESDRFIRVFVGAEEDFFYRHESQPPENPGEVLFFGSFLPLHGVDIIVRAAAKVGKNKGFSFSLVGNGPEWNRCKILAQDTDADIKWEPGWMHYRNLSYRIARSEICLGIFSTEAKAQRVIPCKVFNILAMGKPLITADTPAVREALTHGENAWLVPPGDPEALAEAVVTLHKDAELRKKIAAGGLALYRESFSYSALGKNLVNELKRRFGASSGKQE